MARARSSQDEAGSPVSPTYPLAGCRVLVTRPRDQAADLVERLRALGAEPLAMPSIAILPAGDTTALDTAIRELAGFDWVVFTSANGVRLFCDRLQELGLEPSVLARCSLTAIGPKTAEALGRVGLQPAFVPDTYMAEAVAEGLAGRGVAGKAILLPRAAIAREVLPDRLQALGARVTVIPLYHTVTPAGAQDDQLIERLLAGEVEYITFTSSSTVLGFAARLGEDRLARLPAAVRVATIGPITSRTAREVLGRVEVEASEYTVAGLVAALVQDWRYGAREAKR